MGQSARESDSQGELETGLWCCGNRAWRMAGKALQRHLAVWRKPARVLPGAMMGIAHLKCPPPKPVQVMVNAPQRPQGGAK
jgi:hypothetical protein